MTMISLGSTCAVSYFLKQNNTNTRSFPFDWTKVSINQLNNILENHFEDYEIIIIKKYSNNHLCLTNPNEGSYLLENKFNVKFAHELTNKTDKDKFSDKIKRRISRFYKQVNPQFIRLDFGKMPRKYNEELDKLLLNLNKIFYSFSLTLLIPKHWDIKIKNIFEFDLKIIRFEEKKEKFTWRMEYVFHNIYKIE
uniref:Papain-like cysteine peptidase n=1 Tax=viral metagenome TaxID=1070528 RepID=A0A6C0ACU8_9ZZZZ